MKKKSAILALLLAGAMSFGVMATAGCKKKKPSGSDDSNITTPGGDTPGGDTPGGNTPGGNTPGGTTLGGDTPGTDTPGTNNPEEEKPVILTEDTAISLTAGESRALSASEGTTFISEHPTVATVDSNGVVSAKTAGVAKVKATTGNTVVTCTVIVLKKIESSSSTVSKDPFTFNKTVNIGSVDVSDINPDDSDPNAEEYVVEFSDGAVTQNVANGGLAVEPVGVEKAGYYLTGWNNGSNAYDFNQPVTKNLNLTAQWNALPSGVEIVNGNSESISVVWGETNPSGAKVEYSAKGQNNWKAVDAMLIRKDGTYNSRVDILGLAKGVYDVKVTTSAGAVKEITDVKVGEYDRSGYAHFKYNKGVGAYNDDGTIKNNTLVIYLTEENKNDVLDYCYVDGKKVDITNYVKDSSGTVHKGIGEIFNNRRYSGNDRANVGIARLTHVYGAVTLRVLGTVENVMPDGICSIIGLTDFNSTGNGGTAGDSGGLARIVNARNVTVEGVGEDAVLKGWGFHFVSSTLNRQSEEDGKSFEARNLTFTNYPEDALGMEGEQSAKNVSATISASVERCWVHNNTFLQGGNGAAAEGDKGEGDGSCDFKRGQYYTFSYNYLTDCHKTNLIGNADYALQYNISMHHNWWNDCQSRIPLVRNSNVHFYNNYVFVRGEAAKTSVVHSVRAQAYLFSEYNYYDGCKTVAENGGEGGNIGIKGYNDVYHACYNGDATTKVTDRTQKVANGCQYQAAKIDYSSFDTDSELFYYDAANKKTDALLDDAISARMRVVRYAGTLGHGAVNLPKVHMNENKPASAVPVTTEGVTVDMSGAADGKTVSGVYFSGGFKSGKGKGQLATFTLAAPAVLTISVTSKGDDFRPQIIRSDGKLVAPKFDGELSVQLGAGTYIVTTGQKDKESTILAMHFMDTEASADIRIQAAKSALAAIPETITRYSGDIINAAAIAYGGLIGDERKEISDELYQRYVKAVKAYDDLMVEYVTARIEYIGTVTEGSSNDINAALKAYQSLSADAKLKITNRDKLNAAQVAFEAFAVQNLKNVIDSLPTKETFPLIVDSRPAIELVTELYTGIKDEHRKLSDEQKTQISLTAVDGAINTLTEALKPFVVKEMIAELPADTEASFMSAASKLKIAYEALTADQRTLITAEEKAAYDAAIAKYTEQASKSTVVIFAQAEKGKLADLGFTVSGKEGYKDKEAFDYEGNPYVNPLKMQGDTTITFSTATEMTLTIKLSAGEKTIKINGTSEKANSEGIVTVKLAAGTHKITKGDSVNIYWLTLKP